MILSNEAELAWEIFLRDQYFKLIEEYLFCREKGKFFEISDWKCPQ
jgi:hypothetical protein